MQVREARISPPESRRRNHCGRRTVILGLCSLREVKWCHLSGFYGGRGSEGRLVCRGYPKETFFLILHERGTLILGFF